MSDYDMLGAVQERIETALDHLLRYTEIDNCGVDEEEAMDAPFDALAVLMQLCNDINEYRKKGSKSDE